MGDPEEPQTLAAGELVWAKTRGRQHWCPARLPAACPASSKDAPVSCFGDDPSDGDRRATRLRRFADPAADKMARDAAARGFLSAVEMAHAAAVALLCTGLTCACASPPAPAAAEGTVVVGGVDNLSPSEFLASLRRAALDPTIGLVDRAKLKSWARALAQGWGPAGPGRYPRRSVEELVDKIDLDDLNEPAGEEVDAADEDSDKPPLKTPAPRKRKGRPRKDASLIKDATTAAGEKGDRKEEDESGDQKQEEESGAGPETVLSTGRKRKMSKYLSPPYTNLSTAVLEEKRDDSPKEALPSAAKVEKKVLRDNVDAAEVLELLHSFGEGFFHDSQFPKAIERFLGLLRSSKFAGVDVASLVSDSGAALKLGKSVLERSRKKDEAGIAASSIKRKKKMDKTSPTATLDFPAENVDFHVENVVATDGADAAGLVSDSCATVEQGKGAVKRGRKKKDQDGSGGPSIKRKKVEKTSTPTLPAENASASADGIGLVPHSCATLEEGKKGVTKRGRKKKDQDGSATLEEGKSVTKRGRKKKDQDGSGGPSIKREMMKETSSTSIPDSGVVITTAIPIRQVRGEDMLNQMKSGQNKLVFNSPVSSALSGEMKSAEEQDQGDGGSVVKAPVTVEATLPETDLNVENVVADLPARSVQAEETKPGMGIQVDMNVQSDTVDVPITSVQIEAMELDTDIPDAANVEVRTAQESYASLEAMVPEMCKKVDDEITAGTTVTAMNHVFNAEGQKGEQQSSQKKTAGEAFANHAPAISTNGASSDTANSTPKRRTKKAPQYFANPAEILLEFRDGVILPSKEELLLAFSKFGVLIEPLCGILEDIRGARVVFGKSAEAEAVYSNGASPGVFGQFGPPFASLKRLNYLPPFTPSIPPPAAPAPKPPLGVADMRKNVENMISSLAVKQAAAAAASSSSAAGAKPVPEYLLAEMQRLLSKLDSIQAGPSSGSGGAPPP